MKLPKFLSQNEKLREWLTQFVKFGLVGAVNTLLSLGINYLFIWIDPSLYLWGNFAGWAVSVLNAFYWNNRFVFQKKAATQKELWLRLGKSYVSYGVSFLLSTLLMWLEVDVLGLSEWLSPILTLVITIPLNFVVNKLWTFRK